MTKIILDVKKSNIDQLNNNEIVFNIDKLWSNDDKGLLYKQNAKSISQNDKNTSCSNTHDSPLLFTYKHCTSNYSLFST